MPNADEYLPTHTHFAVSCNAIRLPSSIVYIISSRIHYKIIYIYIIKLLKRLYCCYCFADENACRRVDFHRQTRKCNDNNNNL